jgi:hypothetical protein
MTNNKQQTTNNKQPIKLSYGLLAILIGIASIDFRQNLLANTKLEQKEIADMAKEMTVIIDGQNPGSGAIVAKEGNTYSVLTAKHVLATQDDYAIITPDRKQYPIDYSKVQKLANVDLAIAQFNSTENYRVAQLGNSRLVSVGDTVYVAGWPHPEQPITQSLFTFTSGTIAAIAPRPLPDGYQLVYTNTTKVGMSGGPVIDREDKVIGIHARAQGTQIYVNNQSVKDSSGFKVGIPIEAVSDLATIAKLPSQETPTSTPISETTNINPQLPIQQASSARKLYFTNAPDLIDYATTQDSARVRGATYYFTVSLPEDAGAPLQQLTLEQREGVDFMEDYHLDETIAFEGTRSKRGEKVSVGLVSSDRKNRTITIVFDTPISPGKTVTVGLRPVFTPSAGIYLLRVQGYPPGGKSPNLSLGVARFHFYQRGWF